MSLLYQIGYYWLQVTKALTLLTKNKAIIWHYRMLVGGQTLSLVNFAAHNYHEEPDFFLIVW